MKKLLLITLILMSPVWLTACGDTPPSLEDRIVDADDIPTSPTRFTGTVEDFSLNLYQEGTHQIRTDEGDVVIIQSPTINLNRYLGKKVTVMGKMKKMIGDQGQVFTVSKIELEGADSGEWKSYQDHQAGFNFDYPEAWELTENTDELVFSANGIARMIIETFNDVKDDLDTFVSEKEENQGSSVTIGSRKSIRYIDTDEIRLYVPNTSKNKVYLISFNDSGEGAKEHQDLFYSFLETFSPISGSVVKKGEQCGGEENLLCPENYRCELENNEENAIGTCIEVGQSALDADCPFVATPKNCSNYEVVSKNKNDCPISYICLDVESDQDSSDSDNVDETESSSSDSEDVSAVFRSYQAQILGDTADLTHLEVIEGQQLIAAIYEQGDKSYRTVYEYEPLASEFNFVEIAHYEEGEDRDWVLIDGEAVDVQSDKTVIDLEENEVQVVPEDKRLYENNRQSFTMLYPGDWYYRSFGSIENSVWTGGFSITPLDDVLDSEITVSIQDNAKTENRQVKGDRYSVVLPRGEDTHFSIEGPLASKQIIDDMADSIQATE